MGTVLIESRDQTTSALSWNLQLALPWVCLVWYIIVWIVCSIGHLRIRKSYGKILPTEPPRPNVVLPFISILRPVKGWDSSLDVCLSSTCLLDYPKSRYELLLCVASPEDSAIPVINHIKTQYPDVNVRLFVGEEDIGPNPKIRNLSRGYREAKGDIMWVLDSNIWVSPDVLLSSVRLLEGTDTVSGYKLVHHLPLAVDITPIGHPIHSNPSASPLLGNSYISQPSSPPNLFSRIANVGGARLEENFLSSSHAKFYSAINTLGVAPCVVGKSNLYRRSHLSEVTNGDGILAFAETICEDHLISERLWLNQVADELTGTRGWGKHCLAPGLVFQPIQGMAIADYLARRTRWIRVRKYPALPATLLEPMTESVVASLMVAYALTTIDLFEGWLGLGPSWLAFWAVWTVSMALWALSDRVLFRFLHSYKCVPVDDHTPAFITGELKAAAKMRSEGAWLLQWLGREALALGIWAWALWPGDVQWRGGRYKVRWKDAKVVELARDSDKRRRD